MRTALAFYEDDEPSGRPAVVVDVQTTSATSTIVLPYLVWTEG